MAARRRIGHKPGRMDHEFSRAFPDGRTESHRRAIAQEAPVAIEVNGLGYAVMMATPADLADFATGFALSERIVADAAELAAIDVHDTPRGTIVRLAVPPARAAAVADRVRRRASDSSCGLCGMDNLDAIHRPLPRVPAATAPMAAVFAALAAMRAHQPLNAATGAAHAAMLCAADGTIRCAREDVGRHNAFDKLVGALAHQGWSPAAGFVVLTARCSYELVQKAVIAGFPLLVTVSAASTMAAERAAAHGLRLYSLARGDSLLKS